VIGYELLAGNRPFQGPEPHDFREQHLHQNPNPLSGVPLPIAALIDECLYKAAEARPTPSNLLARLERAAETTPSAGLAQLQQANLAEVSRIKEEARALSEALSEEERRAELAQSASRALARMMDYLKDAIIANAPAAGFVPAVELQNTLRRIPHPQGWTISLNEARLVFNAPVQEEQQPWGQRSEPAIDGPRPRRWCTAGLMVGVS
jgi:hypothetical protein